VPYKVQGHVLCLPLIGGTAGSVFHVQLPNSPIERNIEGDVGDALTTNNLVCKKTNNLVSRFINIILYSVRLSTIYGMPYLVAMHYYQGDCLCNLQPYI
jgi:hypothetical protein